MASSLHMLSAYVLNSGAWEVVSRVLKSLLVEACCSRWQSAGLWSILGVGYSK